ncbi:uncharacterized protein [Rutidosis leptorrhynchoides]|uniref:uncharacterized protein n=1 Tax=Rutidosis leptorrhynchoides TaxID=125765 RepID=UPI003A991D6C
MQIEKYRIVKESECSKQSEIGTGDKIRRSCEEDEGFSRREHFLVNFETSNKNAKILQQRIGFWYDLWVGNAPLKDRFSRLFHLDSSPFGTIADKRNNNEWIFEWTRDRLRGRTASLLSMLLEEIGCPTLSNRSDSWLCSINNEGEFTVKDTRVHMDSLLTQSSITSTSWFKFLPRKVNVFLWRFRLNCLPVRWNLSAKGIDIDSVVCPACDNGVETSRHIFFECIFATEIWRKIRIWLDCGMAPLVSWDSFISWLEGVRIQVSSKNRIIAVVVTSLWALWRFRNGLVFHDSFCSRSNLFDVIRLVAFRWLKNRSHGVPNWNTWLSIPL